MVGEIGDSQIVVNLPVTSVPGCIGEIRGHLDCSTCGFLIWECAAALQTGHA